jgi:hypothetical protein
MPGKGEGIYSPYDGWTKPAFWSSWAAHLAVSSAKAGFGGWV